MYDELIPLEIPSKSFNMSDASFTKSNRTVGNQKASSRHLWGGS